MQRIAIPSPDRRLKLDKRRQLFIHAGNETLRRGARQQSRSFGRCDDLCAGALRKRDVSAQVEMNRIGPQMVVNEQ